jgi:hypothetical protein
MVSEIVQAKLQHDMHCTHYLPYAKTIACAASSQHRLATLHEVDCRLLGHLVPQQVLLGLVVEDVVWGVEQQDIGNAHQCAVRTGVPKWRLRQENVRQKSRR